MAGDDHGGELREGAFRRAIEAGAGKLWWDVGSRALSFALSILVARKLGAEGFGTYALYWYLAWMISQATDLGVHLVSLRSLSRRFEPDRFWSAASAKGALTAGVVAGILVALAAGAFAGQRPLFLWLLAAQLVGSWVEFLGVVLRSRGGIAREGLVLTALRSASLAAAAWALSVSASLETLAAALALSTVPALALALGMLGGIGLPFRRGAGVRDLLREALPLGLVSGMTLLYLRADLFIVGAIAGASEAGLFQSAFRLFEATFVVSGGIAAGTFPLLAARFGEKGFGALGQLVLGLLVALSAPIALAFALAPGPILTVLYGGGFEGAARPLSLLGVALVAVFANALTTHVLVASGRQGRLVLSIAVRLVVGVALDLLLVARGGAAGGALAVAAAEWSLLVVSLASSVDLLFPSRLSRGPTPRAEASSCS